jgi:hypothetical protein
MKLSLDHESKWIEDFARIEYLSLGRLAGRAFLAASKPTERRLTPQGLLSSACRLSFQHENPAKLRIPAKKLIDPLWPALARHIARRSTPEDRALLEDLARHPEKRKPPLEWGLRFIVRGDLLLDDGSFLTLDDLAKEAGIEPLPYLDEMEPELEIDWEEEDEEPSPATSG